MPENDDELEQLRRANPVAPGSVPSADSPRARALFEEITMSDDAAFTNRQSASELRRRRWVGGIAAAIVLIGSGAAAVALRSADGGDGATDVDAAAQPDESTLPDSPAAGEDDDASTSEADRAAQSLLRNAFTAARTISTDYQGRFQKNAAGDPIDGAALQAENPDWDLAYGPPGNAGVDVVSVAVSSVDGPNSHIWLIAQSSGGTFYCLGGTWTGEVSRSTGESEEAAKATCVGGAQEW